MEPIELRNLDDARKYLLQGLWQQRTAAPAAATVRPALEWALEIAASGEPVPPVGFVADLGQAAFSLDRGARGGRESVWIPGMPPNTLRAYEDHVLGKFYADWTFDRASDVLRHLQGRDRARGLAYVVERFRKRAGFAGVLLNPAVIRSLLETAPEEVLARGWDLLVPDDPQLKLLIDQYEALTTAARRCAEVLGNEDLFELEHGTALAEYGQRLALRQVLRAAERLESYLPHQKVRPLAGRQEVPTRVLDEDTYPVGGFSSISTRGSIESLLHSQLAFMEPRDRPDLFDVKFLRDELYYYSRDENQFLRRRRTFVFALWPDLVQSRFMDRELPYQRIILTLALLLAGYRKVSDWLGTDALRFEFLFLAEGDQQPLGQEQELLEMLLRDGVANGTVGVGRLGGVSELAPLCVQRARRSLCHCLTVSVGEVALEAQDTVVSRLRVDGPCPELALKGQPAEPAEGEEPLEGWAEVLETLLQAWV
jgi:hypothetical protein